MHLFLHSYKKIKKTKEMKARMMMMEVDEIRNVVANLQIDIYQLNQKIEMLEEKFEILELKINEILEAIGVKDEY